MKIMLLNTMAAKNIKTNVIEAMHNHSRLFGFCIFRFYNYLTINALSIRSYICMKYKFLLVLSAILFAHLFFNKGYEKGTRTIENDKGGYYVYLPAVFIYHDLARLEFFRTVDSVYKPNGGRMYAIYGAPATGRRFVKYSMGTALCEMPMFLLAHTYCHITRQFAANGYTVPYRISILFSTIIFVMTGLWFLHKLLLRYFPDKIVFAVLVLLLFGTNLYCYSTFDAGMSHPFTFGLFCMMLYTTDTWTMTGQKKYALLTGALLGIIVIVRPINLMMIIIPFSWQVYNIGSLKNRLRFFRDHAGSIAASALACFAILLLQMSYWKYTTGQWLFFSYVDECFHFSDPHIWDGLMSYRKGWYVYTPVAFIATLGFISLWCYRRAFVPPLLSFLCMYIYVVFCWWQWFYGGSFGCRALIDILPMMAIPLCAFIQLVSSLKNKRSHYGVITMLLLLIILNIFQTYQYSLGTIHYCEMNRDYYWRIFGKEKATDDDWKLLNLH